MRAILTYHSIDPSGSVISIDEQTFDRHVRFLSASRVSVLSLSDLVRGDGSGDAVALTFDDGFANFANVAWPRLRDHGLPATVFVVCDRVGRDNNWRGLVDPQVPTMRLLDWDQVGQMACDGVEVGSHSRSHRRLDRAGMTELEHEIGGSADDIESRIGRRPTSFCYPFGAFDERSVAAVSQTYRQACTTALHTLGSVPDPHRLPRIDCFYLQKPGLLEQWGTVRLRTRILGRAALRGARHAVTR